MVDHRQNGAVEADRRLRQLIYEAIVPRELRPESKEDIDAIFAVMDAPAVDELRAMRILRKVRRHRRHLEAAMDALVVAVLVDLDWDER